MPTKCFGLVALCLALAMPATADKNPEKDARAVEPAPKGAKSPRTTAAAATEATKGERKAPTEASAVELELQQLRELIQEQSKQLEMQRAALREQAHRLEALTQELRDGRATKETATAAAVGAASSPTSAGTLVQAESELTSKVDKLQKEVEGKLKGFGPFRFSGDVRVRYEPFFGGGVETSPAPPDRHRERIRMRFNADAKFNDEFSGGFGIASGDTGDPISTNQTLTGFFTRKPIAIDTAFVRYHPRWFKPFEVTAGKFGYPWYRTELTWDNDLNPEGASEALMWDWKDSFLQHFGVVAFQLPVFEVSGGPDTGIFGGQIQSAFKLHEGLKFSAYAGFYHYRDADAIAANQDNGPGAFGSGFSNSGFGGSGLTNFTGTINGKRRFASKFDIFDVIARLDAKTGISRFPLMLQFDFAQNTRACSNLDAFTSAGVTPPFCDPHARHAYWGEVQFGRTQEPGEIRFGYSFIRIERDAVAAAFNFSDLRQPTNVANHRVEVYYQALGNIQVGFTGLIGKQLQTANSPTASVPAERFLKRLEFDLIYKF